MSSRASNDFPHSEGMAPWDTGDGGLPTSFLSSMTNTVDKSPMRTHSSPSQCGPCTITTMMENVTERFLCAHHGAPHASSRPSTPHDHPWETDTVMAALQMRELRFRKGKTHNLRVAAQRFERSNSTVSVCTHGLCSRHLRPQP